MNYYYYYYYGKDLMIDKFGRSAKSRNIGLAWIVAIGFVNF